jgi:hypothetical protein
MERENGQEVHATNGDDKKNDSMMRLYVWGLRLSLKTIRSNRRMITSATATNLRHIYMVSGVALATQLRTRTIQRKRTLVYHHIVFTDLNACPSYGSDCWYPESLFCYWMDSKHQDRYWKWSIPLGRRVLSMYVCQLVEG